LLDAAEVDFDFFGEAGREVGVIVIIDTGFGGKGEAGRDGDADVGHFGQTGAFAAQQVLHLGGPLGGPVAEIISVFVIHNPPDRLLRGYRLRTLF
jgi:hypothetical protein